MKKVVFSILAFAILALTVGCEKPQEPERPDRPPQEKACMFVVDNTATDFIV